MHFLICYIGNFLWEVRNSNNISLSSHMRFDNIIQVKLFIENYISSWNISSYEIKGEEEFIKDKNRELLI